MAAGNQRSPHWARRLTITATRQGPADLRALPVCLPGGEVVAQNALPVALHRVVDAVPVPVLHALRPVGVVGHGLQKELAGVGEIPEVPLGLGFQYEIVVVLEPPGHGPAETYLRPGEFPRALVVDIAPRYGDGPGRLELVHIRLEAEGPAPPLVVEVVGDELVVKTVLVDYGPLPEEEVRHESPLECAVLPRLPFMVPRTSGRSDQSAMEFDQ